MGSYEKYCKYLNFNLSNSLVFAKILEWVAYKYNAEDYKKEVYKLKEKSEWVHQLLVSYQSENWANTFFLK